MFRANSAESSTNSRKRKPSPTRPPTSNTQATSSQNLAYICVKCGKDFNSRQAFLDHAKPPRNGVNRKMKRPMNQDEAPRKEPIYAPKPLRMILPTLKTSLPGLFTITTGHPGLSSSPVPSFRALSPPPRPQNPTPGFGGPAAADDPNINLHLLANNALSFYINNLIGHLNAGPRARNSQGPRDPRTVPVEEIMALVGTGDGVERADSSDYPKPKSPAKGGGSVGDEVNSQGGGGGADGGVDDDDDDFDVIV